MLTAVLALAGGALFPFAFAPFDHPFMVMIALCALFRSWEGGSVRQGFLNGLLFGLGQFGIGTSWVFNSMYLYGDTGLLVSVVLTSLFVFVLALFNAIAGSLACLLLRPFEGTNFRSFHWLLILPSAWLVGEWLRSTVLSGFPWLLVGYSQTDTLLAGFAPVVGVYGLSFIVAFSTTLLMSAMTYSGHRRMLAFMALAAVVLWGAGLSNVRWSEPTGEPLSVALLQGNVAQDIKWRPDAQRATLQQYVDMTRKHWDARLIIWPETAVPAFYHQVAETWLRPLADEARTHVASVWMGVPYVERATSSYRNALISIGMEEGEYFKYHLVPFGEYLPFRQVLGFVLDLINFPMADFVPGELHQPLLNVAGHPVGSSICYEDAFGDEMRHSLPDAAFLVNVTNDAWFGNTIAPHQHWQMARMRAMETSRYLLRSTNTGVSGIINERGVSLVTSALFVQDVVRGQVQPHQGMTPFARYGDAPVLWLVASVLIIYLVLFFYRQYQGKPYK